MMLLIKEKYHVKLETIIPFSFDKIEYIEKSFYSCDYHERVSTNRIYCLEFL